MNTEEDLQSMFAIFPGHKTKGKSLLLSLSIFPYISKRNSSNSAMFGCLILVATNWLELSVILFSLNIFGQKSNPQWVFWTGTYLCQLHSGWTCKHLTLLSLKCSLLIKSISFLTKASFNFFHY